MGLLDAKEYDPRPRQRLVRLIVAALIIVILAVAGFYEWPYYQARGVVNKFFAAVEAKDFEKAYGLWNADPDWKQHPDRYSAYTLNQFVLDWGPSSSYGVITRHSIECLTQPPKKAFKSPTGVIVVIKINNRADPQDDVDLWVEKKTGSIGFSPENRVLCQ
jgi:hypothetical protein